MNNQELRFLLYGHAGYYNRGCEAIVRTTADMVRANFPGAHTILATNHIHSDPSLDDGIVDSYLPQRNRGGSFENLVSNVLLKTGRKNEALEWRVAWLKKILDKADVFLSVGGDKYCYNEPITLYKCNEVIRKSGKLNVFWGASVDPELITAQMLDDLRGFDLITARESLTYQGLCDRGLKNVYLYPDPAFTLRREDLPLPANFAPENTIGLNFSPMSIQYASNATAATQAIAGFIEYILKHTHFNLALIPHVVNNKPRSEQNDLLILNEIYHSYRDSGRMVLIDYRYNAPRLKGFIARCRMFVGARTHATIAAYSCCVPALAIGYSIKARGIARDIFGDESLVLPIQAVSDAKPLIKAFTTLLERENEIRSKLKQIMPDHIIQAGNAMKKVGELLERK